MVRQNGIILYGSCLVLLERMVHEPKNRKLEGQKVRFDFCSTVGGGRGGWFRGSMTERGTKSITAYMKLASMGSMQPLSNCLLPE